MMTVMVVEDNREIAELFKTCLTLCGHMNVLIARSVKEALTTCDQNEGIDGMLVDLTLPDGNGHQLLMALGTRAPNVSMLITGHNVDLKKEYPGFDEYLVKPVDCAQLIDKVRQLITMKGGVQ